MRPVIYIDGQFRTPEECETPDQLAYYWLKFDKLMDDARDVAEEMEHHNNGEGL